MKGVIFKCPLGHNIALDFLQIFEDFSIFNMLDVQLEFQALLHPIIHPIWIVVPPITLVIKTFVFSTLVGL